MRILIFITCICLAAASLAARITPRIIGGTKAPHGSRPYHASVQYIDNPLSNYCGGALVHPRWVLTSARCIITEMYFGLGMTKLSESDGVVVSRSTRSIIHPDYDIYTHYNDIALVQLEDEVPLSKTIQTIPISSTDVEPGTSVLVSGWGTIREGESAYPLYMRQAVLTVVDRENCVNDYRAIHKDISEKMICAQVEGVARDACAGDGGGPLVTNFDKEHAADGVTLQGIVSWGYGCGSPTYPGVYTRVSSYCDWIAENTNNEVRCQ